MDTELEQRIDDAGRDRVLSIASANGWSPSNPPPKWVWNQIIAEAEIRKGHER